MANITIPDQTPTRKEYTVGSSSQDTFTCPFALFSESDLTVYVDGSNIGSAFSITETLPAETSTVVLDTAVSNATVLLVRDIPVTRTTNFPSSGPFPIETLNTQINKAFAILQDYETESIRSVKIKESVEASAPTIADPTGNALNFCRLNSTADEIEFVTLSELDLSSTLDTVFTGLANNDFIVYDSSVSKFVNKTPANVLSIIGAEPASDDNGAFSGSYIHVVEEQAATSDSGNAVNATAYTFNDLILNTIKKNKISGASLASNQVTLPAGTYIATAIIPCHGLGGTRTARCRLYNNTNSTVIAYSNQAYLQGSDNKNYMSIVKVEFTLSATSNISLQGAASTNSVLDFSWGLANSDSFGASNQIYSELVIWKVG